MRVSKKHVRRRNCFGFFLEPSFFGIFGYFRVSLKYKCSGLQVLNFLLQIRFEYQLFLNNFAKNVSQYLIVITKQERRMRFNYQTVYTCMSILTCLTALMVFSFNYMLKMQAYSTSFL